MIQQVRIEKIPIFFHSALSKNLIARWEKLFAPDLYILTQIDFLEVVLAFG